MLRVCLLMCFIGITAHAGEIIGWRTDWTGKYESAQPALEWAVDKHIIWKIPTPNWGNALPVIAGEKLFICAEPATLICTSKSDGKILWQKDFITEAQKKEQAPKTHKVCGYSSMTPVTDGKHIYVMSGYGTVACFDLEGNQVWLKNATQPSHKWGTSASPVIAGGKLIVHIPPKVSAFNLDNGDVLWQTDGKGSWGTPLPLEIGGEAALYTTGGDLIRISDGTILSQNVPLPWTCPISDGKAIYIVDANGAYALEIPEKMGEAKPLKVLWNLPTNKARKNRYYASPVIHEGLLYAITRNGHFVVIDAAVGKLVYETRLKLGGTTYPSIVLAGKHLLVSSDKGKTAIIEPGREFKEAQVNMLEPFRSTPVFDGSRMIIRGLKHLYCIGSQ